MGLVFKGNPPSFSGDIKVEVPTSTYSGISSSNASDSINPYTSQGPGIGGIGQTITEIKNVRAGITGHFYQTLIDSHTNQLFVDSSGSDITGNGSSDNPYQTINPAVANMPSGGGAIILGSGTHVINTNDGNNNRGLSRGYLTDYNKPISFFGTPNATILKSDPISDRDAHVWGCQNTNSEAYGLIFHNMIGTRLTNYSTSLFSNSITISTPAGLWTSFGTLYNCAFKSINNLSALGTASLYYDNSNTIQVNLRNCSFEAGAWQGSVSGASGNTQIDTAASPITYVQTEGTQTNTNDGVTFDADWHIIAGGNDTNNGVYSGSNAWT